MHKMNNSFNVIYVIVLLVIISIIGVLMQLSAGNGDFFVFAFSHLIKIIIGFIILIIIYNLNLRIIYSLIDIVYLLCIMLLILVSILGSIHLGAKRWLHIGPFIMQPSEIMKISLILILAKILSKIPNNQSGNIKNYIIPALLFLIPYLLILSQPDLGTASILLFITVVLFFISGLNLRYFFIVAGIGLIVAPIFWFNLYDYQKQRILTFLDPSQDPLGSGYHNIQSKIAIGSGGFLGKGFLNGTQSQLDFIPEKQTDFVFALFTEEFGFIGAIVLLTLYIFLIINCLLIANKCSNNFGKYTIIGITSTFFFYIFINTGMVSGILPIVGVPLPLVSYGGTSIISIFAGFGLILNLSRE